MKERVEERTLGVGCQQSKIMEESQGKSRSETKTNKNNKIESRKN